MKKLPMIISILLSILIVCVIAIYMNSNVDNNINQGKFRINDMVITSKVKVSEGDSKDLDIYGLSGLDLSLSQNNEVLISVIGEDAIIKECYIDNVIIDYPKLQGEIKIYDYDKGMVFENNKINIPFMLKEDIYELVINLNNNNFITNLNLPNDLEEVIYDATIINNFDIDIYDLIYSIRFNLNIIEEDETHNVCEIYLDIPDNSLGKVGNVILRKDISNITFKIVK